MKKKNEDGLTLIEILASITILSILTIGLLSIFPKVYSFTKTNQNKTVAIHIARGALHYFEKQDYDLLNGYLLSLGEGKVAILDTAAICSKPQPVKLDGNPDVSSSPLFPDADSCSKILEPTINNITYQKYNVQVFLMPQLWGDTQTNSVLQYIQTVHPKTVFVTIPKTLQTFQQNQSNRVETPFPTLRILVYVDLNEKDDKEGILLEGEIAHESIR